MKCCLFILRAALNAAVVYLQRNVTTAPASARLYFLNMFYNLFFGFSMSVSLILSRTALKKETKPRIQKYAFTLKMLPHLFWFSELFNSWVCLFPLQHLAAQWLWVFFLKNEPEVYLLSVLPNIKFCYKAALAQRWFESICCARKAEWFMSC